MNRELVRWELHIHDLRWFSQKNTEKHKFEPIDEVIKFSERELLQHEGITIHAHMSKPLRKLGGELLVFANKEKIENILTDKFPDNDISYDEHDEMFTVDNIAIVEVKAFI